ncbi:MAG TPA: 5-(carboxyamino)imidazole ribonucleotide mutase [Firmicutes bacterium]|nr:5-(carboxyamino)imidazole ribonucleotide mutase [Bacillota bacterium]
MTKQILVGIVMGSDSDLPVMADAAAFLDEMGVGYEMRIISAHRTPDVALSYANSAAERGLKVIIAGAGKAAHLPGVLAAYTHLPVIGVPILSSTLAGTDALYSIVQMPTGIPVACVAINGAKNAAILACQMLGIGDERLAAKVQDYKARLAEEVRTKDQRLQEQGWRAYT